VGMMRRRVGLCITAAVFGMLVIGCGQQGRAGISSAAVQAAAPLLISPEDVLVVEPNGARSGAVITGSVDPERRADLRAEVSAVVLQVLRENGDSVHRGDLLVRLDDTAIRDALISAEAGERAASQASEQAERQFQRLRSLRAGGLVSAPEVEDAEIRRNNSQSELEAAKSRAAVARQQLLRTEIRAPFDGIVTDRKVYAGDTAQIGKELLKVIDPRSLRIEGKISSEDVGQVRVGQVVRFRVHGYAAQEFIGRVTRINPAANAITREVEVLVGFADGTQQPRLAGLYAEGMIETNGQGSLMIPPSAFVREGQQAFAWCLRDRALHKVALTLGERDARSGEFRLNKGLAAGDQILRYPGSSLHDGQAIELVK